MFEQSIETEDPGMCCSTTYYDLEDIYQAFKERLCRELGVKVPNFLTYGVLEDLEDK